jgi:HD-like signal output (HDOD) protein
MSLVDAERAALGATHAEVGAYLLGLWGFPDPVLEAVAWHHSPGSCPGNIFSPLTAVHAANVLLARKDGVNQWTGHGDMDGEYLTRLGLSGRLEEWHNLVEEPSE